jgi:hypothetical protein
MTKLHIVTVANKYNYYLKYLIESCKNNGIELTILGLGKEWQGYAWKFKLMIAFLKSIDNNDIVCFIDGYDVICVRNLNEMIDEFIIKQKETKCKIIIGNDNYKFFIQELCALYYFNKCNLELINSGTYIGYVKDIKDILLNINIKKINSDDQVLLTKYCNKNPSYFYIDKNNNFFLVIHKPLCEIDKYITIHNKTIYYNNEKPFFIHAPSCTKLNNILIKLNYNIKPTEIKNINNQFKKYLIKKTSFYSISIIKQNKLFIIILIIIFLIKNYY